MNTLRTIDSSLRPRTSDNLLYTCIENPNDKQKHMISLQILENIYSDFSIKTYAVGTQWCKQMSKLKGKKIITIIHSKTLLINEQRDKVHMHSFEITVYYLMHDFLICSGMLWASARENLSSGLCKQNRRRPAWADAQSHQRLCYSLFGKYSM